MEPPSTLLTFGTVHLADWISAPRGQVRGIRGQIEVVSDEDAVGFRSRGHNSANWIARVVGPTQTWHVFGCQVRAIVEHPVDADEMVDVWTVA